MISAGNRHAKCETFRSLGTRAQNSVILAIDRLNAVQPRLGGVRATRGALRFLVR
ncbi:hypothetical protein SLNWT_3952 [Streptomyces albus]|uniref:Uncharacterized protein n=1 Tax=Streptomyces albus (strain ATCC 21838 / DSM 41398 / FERM P-419 / JCM 4703 / NBRC 107858) TaxID=1081613 RepID=A0A0B5ENU4_STRA4|nr:hypothetical protein SLNWT_3952 [Streptomyces albus]AOU78636.1 hypothetical protein SLNHY_3945 [Streptomyces albus]AYN34376.1 hypothetical protein DUI70_3877 [Streptomyces albus]